MQHSISNSYCNFINNGENFSMPIKAKPVTEILWAAENGDLDLVKKLLSQDPELVNVKDSDGYTPLHRACYNDHSDVTEVKK